MVRHAPLLSNIYIFSSSHYFSTFCIFCHRSLEQHEMIAMIVHSFLITCFTFQFIFYRKRKASGPYPPRETLDSRMLRIKICIVRGRDRTFAVHVLWVEFFCFIFEIFSLQLDKVIKAMVSSHSFDGGRDTGMSDVTLQQNGGEINVFCS